MKKIFMAIAAVAIASASYAQGIEVTETQNVLSGDSYFGGNVDIKGTLKIGNKTIEELISKSASNTNANLSGSVTLSGSLSAQGSINSGNSISAPTLTGSTISATSKLTIGSPISTANTLNVGGNEYVSGNVGIGATPSSSYNLYVNGKVRANKIYVGTNNYDVEQKLTDLLNYKDNTSAVSSHCATLIVGDASAPSPVIDRSYKLNVVGASNLYGNVHTPGTVSCQKVSAGTIVYTNTCSKASDKRFKKNIKNLPTEVVSKLKQIESKTYQYKSQDELLTLYQSVNGDTAQVKYFDTNRDQYGFLAQDFENVFPELVYTDSVGLKSIDYISLIPILLQAIQEQQTQIDYLLANAEIKTNNGNHNGQDNGNNGNGNNGNGNGNGNKRNGSNNVSNANSANGNSQVALKATKPAEFEQTEIENVLFQNTPNPFSQETQIEYTLANDAQNAMICIYNMNGEQMRCFPLNIESNGVLTIEANDLKAGMYLYSLLVNDQLIDTKRMVLTF